MISLERAICLQTEISACDTLLPQGKIQIPIFVILKHIVTPTFNSGVGTRLSARSQLLARVEKPARVLWQSDIGLKFSSQNHVQQMQSKCLHLCQS